MILLRPWFGFWEFGLMPMILVGAFVVFYALIWFAWLALAACCIQAIATYSSNFSSERLRLRCWSLPFLVSFGDAKEIKSVGKDIMICVDLSKSMDAFDIQPTRLEKWSLRWSGIRGLRLRQTGRNHLWFGSIHAMPCSRSIKTLWTFHRNHEHRTGSIIIGADFRLSSNGHAKFERIDKQQQPINRK